VFYTPSMVSHASQSASKPSGVVASWIQLPGVAISVIRPTPAEPADFYRAHDRAFVNGLLAGEICNGFGTKAKDVAESLPWTTGAMASAAREAIRNGLVAFAPTAGYHHAGYSTAKWSCSFNGLIVSALALRAEGLAGRVGILDCDVHHGDGTQELIDRLGLEWVKHWSVGAHYGRRADTWEFFRELPAVVESMADCGVVLCQLGADMFEYDAMGDGWLSMAALARRDGTVFATAHRVGLPVAVCLGGGYGALQTILNLHDATLLEAAKVYLAPVRKT
jgi:acetoin utilization deacetylase AcuC-like enzyme